MKEKRLFAIVALILFASLATAACGGSDDSASTPAAADPATSAEADIVVASSEFAFDPATLNITADAPTVVELVNNGNIEHDFVIEGYEADKLAASPGQSATGTFTLPAGSYKFYCSIPGHEAAGMVGTIEVG